MRVFPQQSYWGLAAPAIGLAVGLTLALGKPKREHAALHLIAAVTLVPLVHELGHVSTAWLLFKKASPRIFYSGLFPKTTYAVSYGLTRAGQLFGKEGALAITAAGGLIASSAFALLMRKRSRRLAIQQLFQEAVYCLQAIKSGGSLSHDYIRLWVQHGVHPGWFLAWLGLATYFQSDA